MSAIIPSVIGPFSVVLCDLDGTLADSAPGIVRSMAHAFRHVGVAVPPAEVLLSFVGPPIMDSFRITMRMDHALAELTLAAYRTHYEQNGLTPSLYSGIDAVLRALDERGMPLAAATSKPESLATAILASNNLVGRFATIAGASEDEARSSKADVVAEALRRLELSGHDTSRPVLVGDRVHDIEGAAAHGVPAIFVAWGYGSEVEAEGAVAVASSPEDLLSLILPGWSEEIVG